jgi:cytochrome oxidase Cu insertion factor (SCO1/SenC/PrrC family)
MQRLKVILSVGLLGLLLAMDVLAQIKLGPQDGAGLPPADLNRVKAGVEAPAFTLEDQDGKPVALADYRGKQTVVLVFYRGYW